MEKVSSCSAICCHRCGAWACSATPQIPCSRKPCLTRFSAAGRPTGTEIQPVVMVSGPDEFESAFMTMVRERADAVVVQGSLAIKPVTDMAIKYRLPAASTARVFAEIGGLICYLARMGLWLFGTALSSCREFYKANSRKTYLLSSRRSSSWSSISRLQGHRAHNSRKVFAARRRVARLKQRNVRYWHKADIPSCSAHVCFRG